MRVLGRTRISRQTEESTSIERQRLLIEQWAQAHDHTIVGWAEDIDVSGAVNPFDTPGLGPWLRPPAQNQWDIIVAWKLDRLARNSLNVHRLFGWVQENNKTLVCVSDNIDLSTWVGRLVASVIAGVAEGELEAIKERTKAGRKRLAETGRWTGGRPLYGYTPTRQDTGGWRLEHHPEEQIILQRIIQETLAGKSIWETARELNDDGVPSPTESRYGATTVSGWTGNILKQILTNKALLGWSLLNGTPVLDAEGKPVLKAEPSISIEDFEKIQTLLPNRPRANKTGKPSALHGVIKCWECGGDLAVRRATLPGGTPHTGYHCKNNCLPHSINGKQIEATVADFFRERLGECEILEKRFTPGRDTASELQEAEAAYAELAKYIPTAPTTEARAELFKQLNILGDRIQTLGSMPTEPTVTWEGTGRTYREAWDAMDEAERRQFMVNIGFTVRVRQESKANRYYPGIQQVEFHLPKDLELILKEKNPLPEGRE